MARSLTRAHTIKEPEEEISTVFKPNANSIQETCVQGTALSSMVLIWWEVKDENFDLLNELIMFEVLALIIRVNLKCQLLSFFTVPNSPYQLSC